MMAMAVAMATGLQAPEAGPIVEPLDKRAVIEELMTIFKQTSL